MPKYDGSERCKAFEELQRLLTQAQVELAARVWEGSLSERMERAAQLRGAVFEAVNAYAKAREEERAAWTAI